MSDKFAKEVKEAHEWLKGLGITDGTRPNDTAAREEVWVMLYRFARVFFNNKIRP